MHLKFRRVFPLVCVALMVIGLFGSVVPVYAVNEHQVFIGATQSIHESYDLSAPMQYGFHVSLFSTLQMPSSWYLIYTMGFYIMNASNTGYYVGFHQYRGHAEIYINPVVNGVAMGLDGQASNFYSGAPTHLGLVYDASSFLGNSLNLLTITVDYNYTTGYFAIKQNGNILVANSYSGDNFVFAKYAYENPQGRDGIVGTVAFSTYGADNSDGSFDNPIFNGVDFKILTDGIENPAGGSIVWNSSTYPIGATGSGSAGFVGNLSISDSVSVEATPSSGYSFASFYVMNNYTGQFFPAGYYDLNGRLIASLDLTHVYAQESGQIINRDPGLFGVSAPLPSGLTLANYGWQNNTGPGNFGVAGIYLMVRVDGAYHDSFTNWDAWWGGSPQVVPQSAGVYVGNPVNFQFWGSNMTIFASFTSINYNPNSIGSGNPNPTSPGGLGGLDLTIGHVNLSFWMVVAMVAGALVTFGGVVILMKASDAWLLGLILLVAGFFTTLYGQPNLIGPFAFASESICYIIFLYSGNGKRGK